MDADSHILTVSTRGRGLLDLTRAVQDFVERLRVSAPGPRTGVVHCFLRHTSASLVVQENADPEVLSDLERFFARLVPDGDPLFRHATEGPDDMPAHIRAALTQAQLSIPIEGGRPVLGTWQGIYLFEHRTAPHRREIALHLIGD